MGKQKHIHNTSSYAKWTSFGMAGLVVVFGVVYLYATNRVAVQGYAIREAERSIAALKQDNNRLRIQEAELKSLYRIEESGRRMNMFESPQVSYIEDSSPIALK